MNSVVEPPEAGAWTLTTQAFWVTLSAIAGVALAIRSAVVLWIHPTVSTARPSGYFLWGDPYYYHWQGRAIADGLGFIEPVKWTGVLGAKAIEPSAYHPPLYSLYLAGVSVFGGTSVTAHRLASGLLGAAAVLVIGLVGRRLAGPRAGLIAAALAAVYPQLWANDEMLLSESMYALTIALVLFAVYRFWARPDVKEAIVVGVAVALAALTRTEAVLLYPLLVVPIALMLRSIDIRRRLALVGVAVIAGIVVIGPWTLYNLTRFSQPVFIASGLGSTLLQGNCDNVYSDQYIGYHFTGCWRGISRRGDESEQEARFFDAAVDYVKHHSSRAPVVVAARVGRVWDVFRPSQNALLNWRIEGRIHFASYEGLYAYWALMPLAVVGLVVLHRRGIPILPFIMLAVLVTLTAATAFGLTRYRVPAEVGIVVLAGVTIDRAASFVGERRRRSTTAASTTLDEAESRPTESVSLGAERVHP